MRKNGIRFAELRELLLSVGFSESVEQTRMTFAYPSSGTFLLFRPYGPKDRVSDRDMLVVRRQLLDNGLIEPSTLDRFLEKALA
jgi:hypothetical protein